MGGHGLIETKAFFQSAQGDRMQHDDPIVFIHNSGRLRPYTARNRRYYGRVGRYEARGEILLSLRPDQFGASFKEFVDGEENKFLVMTNGSKSKKVTVIKRNRSYFINGDKVSYKNLCKLLTLIVLKWDKTTTSEDLDDLVVDFMETPQEITDAIVNKIKYKFLSSEGEEIETLMDIDIIGPNTCAVQLYTDIWVELEYRQANMFIRACKGNSNKYSAIPFQELYYNTTGEHLTSSQVSVIEAFMIQNKSSTLVTKRSMELVEKLHKTFPNIHKVEIKDGSQPRTGLYIRGVGASWAVTHHYEEGQHVLGRQNVRTEMVNHIMRPEKLMSRGLKDENFDALLSNLGIRGNHALTDGKNFYTMGGSICIDQTESNISLGDQIASRSLLLVNDIDNVDKVSTLRGYNKYMGKPRNEESLTDGVLSLRTIPINRKTIINWFYGNEL